jgi:hypothetical protein
MALFLDYLCSESFARCEEERGTMKNPRFAPVMMLVSICLPLLAQVAQVAKADDFDQNGNPSAEIVNELATDDVPAQAPDSDRAPAAPSSPSTAPAAPAKKSDGTNSMLNNTAPTDQATAESTDAENMPTNGVPVARF